MDTSEEKAGVLVAATHKKIDKQALIFNDDIEMEEYVFFGKHKPAFKTMWSDHTKAELSQLVEEFFRHSETCGFIKEMPNNTVTTNYLQKVKAQLLAGYALGKRNTALALMRDIVILTLHRVEAHQPRGGAQRCDPFYSKDSRETFRKMFGEPNNDDTYKKMVITYPVFLRFGGAVCRYLRFWLETKQKEPLLAMICPAQSTTTDSDEKQPDKVVCEDDQEFLKRMKKQHDEEDAGMHSNEEPVQSNQDFIVDSTTGQPLYPVPLEEYFAMKKEIDKNNTDYTRAMLNAMPVHELQKALKKKGLKRSGDKAAMTKRLYMSIEDEVDEEVDAKKETVVIGNRDKKTTVTWKELEDQHETGASFPELNVYTEPIIPVKMSVLNESGQLVNQDQQVISKSATTNPIDMDIINLNLEDTGVATDNIIPSNANKATTNNTAIRRFVEKVNENAALFDSYDQAVEYSSDIATEHEQVDTVIKPHNPHKRHRCKNCGSYESEYGDYKKCALCVGRGTMFYCGRTCQERHWHAKHWKDHGD